MSQHDHFPAVSRQISLRAIIFMVLASFFFAVTEQVGLLSVDGITLYQLVWGRYAVHLLFMIIVLGPHYKTTLLRTGNLKLQIVRSMTMFAMPLAYIVAVQQKTSGDIWAIYWSHPLMMLALSAWVLKERAGIVRWVVAALGCAGMFLILQPDRDAFGPVIILSMIIIGLSMSIHLTCSRILRDDHPVTSLFHTALWVFIGMTFFMPFVWQPPSLHNLVGIVLVGLFGMLALLFLARAGELAPIPIVASFAYTQALAWLILDLFVFHSPVSKHLLLGCAVVTIVAGFSLYHELRRPQHYVEPQASDAKA